MNVATGFALCTVLMVVCMRQSMACMQSPNTSPLVLHIKLMPLHKSRQLSGTPRVPHARLVPVLGA